MPSPNPKDVIGYAADSDSSESTGTGAFRLNGLLECLSPFNGMDLYVMYVIVAVDINGVASGEYEIGFGRYLFTQQIVTRDSVVANSASGCPGLPVAPMSFSAGTKYVTLTPIENIYIGI